MDKFRHKKSNNHTSTGIREEQNPTFEKMLEKIQITSSCTEERTIICFDLARLKLNVSPK
jgi:hypothetical protein